MFTGLVQRLGTLRRITPSGAGARLSLRLPVPFDRPLSLGESIAVNGTCLTLVSFGADTLSFDVLAETLHRTALARKPAGALLNLERALRAGDPLGGHLLSGHVDATATVLALSAEGAEHRLRITLPPERAPEVLPKGSIAIDGVSLTVVEAAPDACTVHLIPATWRETALHALRPGDPVNVETDLVAKQLRAAAASLPAPSAPPPPDRLRQLRDAGF